METQTEKALVLRTCAADMTSYRGFRWPESGPASCPDWNPKPACGNGLHGLLWGEGDGSLISWDPESRWLVVEVDPSTVVELSGKVKFPAGVVVFCGDRLGATEYLNANGGAGRAIVGGTATAGDRGTATAGHGGTATAGDRGTATAGHGGTATAGDRGTATAGYGGTATAGYGGTATAGDRGTATAGDRGTATAGHGGTATAGDRGTATAGDRGTATAGHGGTATAGHGGTATATAGHGGTATAGDRGTATAGHGGTATAGDRGTATAGYGGTATAGYGGTATAGDRGTLIIRRYDSAAGRYRAHAADVGENGILPNVAYRLTDTGLFVPAEVTP